MTLNEINQNSTKTILNLNSYMTSMLGFNFGNNTKSNSYYAKQGEPTYQKDMDNDNDGIVSFDDFRQYCKENNTSSDQITNMLKDRMSYQLSKITNESSDNKDTQKVGNLDLIYAEDGENNFDEKMDFNSDKRISYSEYLRYCEQNAKPTEQHSDTKVMEDNNNRFMTTSYSKISSAYKNSSIQSPQIKIESKV